MVEDSIRYATLRSTGKRERGSEGGVIEIGGEMDGKGEKEGKKMEIHAPRSPDW